MIRLNDRLAAVFSVIDPTDQVMDVGCDHAFLAIALKEKYKDNPSCKFREISDTFILHDKKWIITSEYLTKQLTKRKPDRKIYSAEVIRNALRKN